MESSPAKQLRPNLFERVCPVARRRAKKASHSSQERRVPRDPLLAAGIYNAIHADDKPFQRQWLNNAKCIWLHLNRVLEQPGVSRCATESEKAYVTETREMKASVIEASPLLGFMAWRRSSMFLLVILSAGLIAATFPFTLLTDGFPLVPRMDISYLQWKAQYMQYKPCTEVDKVFNDLLLELVTNETGSKQGVIYREDAATSCSGIVAAGSKAQMCDYNVTKILAEQVVTVESFTKLCGVFVPWCVCRTQLRRVCPTECEDDASGSVTCESHTEHCGDILFANYTKFWWQTSSEVLLADWKRAQIIYKLYSLPMNTLMLLAAVHGANSWSSWARSAWFIVSASGFAFVTPFFFSILPTAFYVNAGAPFDEGVKALQRSIRMLPEIEHFEFDLPRPDEVEQAWVICSQTFPDMTDSWNKLSAETSAHCASAIGASSPTLCSHAANHSQNINNGITDMSYVCGMVQQHFDTHGVAVFQRELDSAANSMAVLLRLFSGLNTALMSSIRLWPVALAVSPALISGSMMAKILVPQASLPGTFVILLPMLQVPLSWALGSAFIEVVWSLYGGKAMLLLLGLFLIGMEPLTKTFIGHRYKLNAPMEQFQALEIIGRAKALARIIHFIAAVCLVAFFFVAKANLDDRLKHAAAAVSGGMRSGDELLYGVLNTAVNQPTVWIAFLVNFGVRFLLIQICSLDFMISIAANERKYESMKKRQEEFETQFGNIKRLQYYRNKNLDLLVDLVGLEGDEVEPESQPKALARVPNSPQSGQHVPVTVLSSMSTAATLATTKQIEQPSTVPMDNQKDKTDRGREQDRGRIGRDRERGKEKERDNDSSKDTRDKEKRRDREARDRDKEARDREKDSRKDRDKVRHVRSKDTGNGVSMDEAVQDTRSGVAASAQERLLISSKNACTWSLGARPGESRYKDKKKKEKTDLDKVIVRVRSDGRSKE